MQHFALISALLALSEGVKLPSSFLKCNRRDQNWKDCVFKAGVHGWAQLNREFPQLNIPSLNPLRIPEVNINVGGRTLQVTQTFRNISLFGLTKVDAKELDFDFERKTLTLEGTFPEVTISGKYKIDGRLLLLPIVGEGDTVTVLKNFHCRSVLHFEETKKSAKTYIRITSSDVKMSPGLIKFRLDNLFRGDKTLGDNINQVLNENWKAVYDDFEDPLTDIVKKIVVGLLDGFFRKVSIEEAFD